MSNLNTTTTTSTQSQNSNTTTTTKSCSVPGFITTKKPCNSDPIIELFELMVKSAVKANYSNETYAQVIDRILDKGVIDQNCDKCCPDCGNIYVFAGKDAFIDLAEEIGWAESAAVPA
jgi:hypothetical protein